MEMAHIPRSFWHALSVCMVSATGVLLYIALSASSVSIEVANAKIQISSALAEVRGIKADLEAENTRLLAANERLQSKLQELESQALVNGFEISPEEIEKLSNETLDFRNLLNEQNSEAFQTIETRLQAAENFLRE